MERGETVLTNEDFLQLVMIYSGGYAAIWLIFLMYIRAWKLRTWLKLDAYKMIGILKQIRGAI